MEQRGAGGSWRLGLDWLVDKQYMPGQKSFVRLVVARKKKPAREKKRENRATTIE